MPWRNGFLAVVALMLMAHAAHAAPLPPAVSEIIDAAADDPDTLGAVVKAVKKANPDSAADIDAYVATLTAKAATEKAARVADQGVFEGWTGEIDLGGATNSGNTDDYSFTAALALERKGPRWAHEFDLRISFKNEDEETTTDRYFATYGVTRDLGPRLYVGGVLWAERDRFAGHNYRFSEGVGLGYRLIKRPELTLSLEGGPALRQSDYLDRGSEATVAARVAGYLTWRIARGWEFKQDLVIYADTENSTLLSTSALTARQQGRISTRLSYEVRHEDNPPAGREHTDKTARISVVLSY